MTRAVLPILSVCCLLAWLSDSALAAPPEGYVLIDSMSDEFNSTTLDATKWDYRTDYYCDSSTHVSEQQANNVELDGSGVLTIHMLRESGAHCGLEYTGGGIISEDTMLYGYCEARVKLFDGAGWHMSFWASTKATENARIQTEIDGFEVDSEDPEIVRFAAHRIGSRTDDATFLGPESIGGEFDGIDTSDGFHVYGWRFTPYGITYYVDGYPVHYADYIGPHESTHVRISAIALLDASEFVDDNALPGHMEVDYVRCYEKDVTTIVVDNGDTGYFEYGNWMNSSLLGYNQSSTRYLNTAGYVDWTSSLEDSNYFVEIYKISHSSSDTNTNIEVFFNGGYDSSFQDWSTGSSGFVELGTFNFRSGGMGFVRATRGNNNARTDAVRFTPSVEEPIVIDNGDDGYQESGDRTWLDSSLLGYAGQSTRYLAGDGYVTWTPTLIGGSYRVFIYPICNSSSDPDARVEIHWRGKTTEIVQDWTDIDLCDEDKISVGQCRGYKYEGWCDLGTYDFERGDSGYVKLSKGNSGSGYHARADAVRFERVEKPVSIVDTGDYVLKWIKNYIEDDSDWSTSGLTGYSSTNTRYCGRDTAEATWIPEIVTGAYRVYIYRLVHATSDAAATIEIGYSGGVKTIVQNWQQGTSGWSDLGLHYFIGDGTGYVNISKGVQSPSSVNVRADAVLFMPEGRKSDCIDHGVSEYYEEGSWSTDSSVTGYNGTSTRILSGAGYAKWVPNLIGGEYRVFIWRIVSAGGDTNVQIDIDHLNGICTTYQDWTSGLGGWNDLGTYMFDRGTNCGVKLSRSNGTGRSDAVLFMPQ